MVSDTETVELERSVDEIQKLALEIGYATYSINFEVAPVRRVEVALQGSLKRCSATAAHSLPQPSVEQALHFWLFGKAKITLKT